MKTFALVSAASALIVASDCRLRTTGSSGRWQRFA